MKDFLHDIRHTWHGYGKIRVGVIGRTYTVNLNMDLLERITTERKKAFYKTRARGICWEVSNLSYLKDFEGFSSISWP